MSSHVGLKQLRCRQKNWVRNQNVHSATQKSQASKCDHPSRGGDVLQDARMGDSHSIPSAPNQSPRESFDILSVSRETTCQLSWVSRATLCRTIWSPSLPSCLLSLLTAVQPLWGSKVICENGDLTKLLSLSTDHQGFH